MGRAPEGPARLQPGPRTCALRGCVLLSPLKDPLGRGPSGAAVRPCWQPHGGQALVTR